MDIQAVLYLFTKKKEGSVARKLSNSSMTDQSIRKAMLLETESPTGAKLACRPSVSVHEQQTRILLQRPSPTTKTRQQSRDCFAHQRAARHRYMNQTQGWPFGRFSMLAIDSILMTEKRKLEIQIENLQAEIDARPRGSLVHKQKGATTYVYLAHREGSKVVTDYVGKSTDRNIGRLAAKIAERRKYHKELARLKPELMRIQRLIKVSTPRAKAGTGGLEQSRS